MLSDTPLIVVVNESKFSDVEAWRAAWACNYQVRWQFGPLWRIHAEVTYLPHGAPVPAGAWIAHLLDDIPEAPDALGYHDEDGKEVPFCRVGVNASEQAGIGVAAVLSHEVTETLCDPHVTASAWDEASGRLYAYEVGDPCQGGDYDIGAPYNKVTGIEVADFVLTDWFDPKTSPTAKTSYRGECHGAFDLGRGGYVQYTEKLPPDWQQEFGEFARRDIADADDRLSRRASAAQPS